MSVWTTATVESKLIEVYNDRHEQYEDSQSEKLGTLLASKGVDLKAIQEGTYKEIMTLNPKYFWLVVLSLLVCLGGIMNAMLMSVTERYRDIGTMKCLGALDSFILKLFVLESSVQGLIGTFIGLVIGGILAVFTSWLSYDEYAFKYFPFYSIMGKAGITMIFGFFISIVGAWYPAKKAAGMEPAVAMMKNE
jgi:ABC-type lipoprotein release transport system permease subunit